MLRLYAVKEQTYCANENVEAQQQKDRDSDGFVAFRVLPIYAQKSVVAKIRKINAKVHFNLLQIEVVMRMRRALQNRGRQ